MSKKGFFSSRGSAPHPAGAQPQTPVCTHTPVSRYRPWPPRGAAAPARDVSALSQRRVSPL